jgi:hypothetical protein
MADRTFQPLIDLHAAVVNLYPRPFKEEFAAEMGQVFSEALAEACGKSFGAVLRLCLREFGALPGALLSEHFHPYSMEGNKMNNPAKIFPAVNKPGLTFGEYILAVLPYLLYLLIRIIEDVLDPEFLTDVGLFPASEAAIIITRVFSVIILASTVIGVFILAWRQKWPLWSGSWLFFFTLLPFLLVLQLITSLGLEGFDMNQGYIALVAIPAIIAIILYLAIRRQPAYGLLAVLPVLYLIWSTNLEFVPSGIKMLVILITVVIFGLTVAIIMRQGDWRLGLIAALAGNLGGGLAYSFVGIYYGGYLPFTAPGPSPVEVLVHFVPQYLATGAILLGPFFARKFRQIGQAGGTQTRISYHVALAGLFIIILTILSNVMMATWYPEFNNPIIKLFRQDMRYLYLLVGLGVYILGVIWLFAKISHPSRRTAWLERALLALLPLALPLALTMPFISNTQPVSMMYGIPLVKAMPHVLSFSLGLVWLSLSTWVVVRGRDSGSPSRPAAEMSSFESVPTP